MTGLQLRPATPTDAGRVGDILSAYIDATPWLPRIHTRAEDLSFAGHLIERGWVSVALAAGRVQGFLARQDNLIHALYVDAPARGSGCGTALLRQAMAAAPALDLWTFQANAPAQAFYTAHGFAEVERTNGQANDEKLPDIRFAWKRSPV